MRISKHFFPVLVIGLLVCVTFGVFGGGEQEEVGKPSTWLIGISQPNDTHPIRRAQYDVVRKYEATHPEAKFIVTSARLSSEKQTRDIEDLIARRVDLIMVCPHQSEALVPALQRVVAAGIPFMAFDRQVASSLIDESVTYVGTDYVAKGRLGGELTVDAMGEEGNLAIIEGVQGSASNIDNFKGFRSVIDEYPDIIVIADQVGNYQREQAITVMENILQAHDDIDFVFAENDEMGFGAIAAIQAADRQDEIQVGSMDGQKEAIKAVMDGDLAFTVKMPIFFPEALDVAVDILDGKKVDKKILLPNVPITPENAKEYYDPQSIF
jgi:ABC-type sugar transport system substrate-binding protein